MAGAHTGEALRQLDRLFSEGSLAGLSDAQLLERFVARRDELAFAALVTRHGPMVLGTCRAVLRDPHEAEDAFQAVFLVLVQRAGTIRGRDALGGWLHRVAYRTALRANAACEQRRKQERRAREVAIMRQARDERPDDDLGPVLHAELDRLPDRLRLPLVLCDLEGLTRAQAAAQLRWTEGAVRGRLHKARALLRARLSRRGIALGAGASAPSWGSPARAEVPAAWIEATVRAAVAELLGRATAVGSASALAIALANRMRRAMIMSRLKPALTLGMTLAAAIGIGIMAVRPRSGGAGEPDRPAAPAARTARPEPKPAPDAAPDPSGAAKERVEFRGQVLDPDGKPFAGATIYVAVHSYDPDWKFPSIQARATSDADGRYHISIPEVEFTHRWGGTKPGENAAVVAMASGFGPGLAIGPDPDGKQILRLVRDDVPVEGRLVDIQGRPVAGANVQVVSLLWTPDGDLTPWLEALRAEQDAYVVQGRFLERWGAQGVTDLFPAVMTDANGRFTLKGLGRERVAGLWIEGPTIETAFAHVRTRPGETLQIPEFPRGPSGKVAYHGAKFEHVVGPTRPVVGTVRDKDTGRPIPGVTVQGTTAIGHPLRYVKTTTDAQGRYRLVGLSPGKNQFGDDQDVGVIPPQGQPYLQLNQPLEASDSLEPVTRNFALKRGVWITGRVIDKATGQPLRARLEYYVYGDNPHLKDYPGFGYNRVGFPLSADEKGAFRIVGIPGRGLLGARANDDRYRMGTGMEKLDKVSNYQGIFQIDVTEPHHCIIKNFHAIVLVEASEGVESVRCDLVIDPGRTVKGTVVGPDGRPLPGARLYGLKDYFNVWEHQAQKTAELAVWGLGPEDSRLVLAVHEGKQLAGRLVVKGDEIGPVTLKLEPWGTLTGRLVDGDGRPRTSVGLTGNGVFGQVDTEVGSLPNDTIKLDKDGRFRAEGLVPGMKYSLQVHEGNRIIGRAAKDQTVRAGETKDLGDVRVGQD